MLATEAEENIMSIDPNVDCNIKIKASINWKKMNGIIPVIVQNRHSLSVLMLGYMNPEALEKTLSEKRVTFFSRGKNRLWTKGETSGHFLSVHEVFVDCDNDTLLILVDPIGPTCHSGEKSCFGEHAPSHFLNKLSDIIENRKTADTTKSYTAKLFQQGLNRISQKIGEEATEVILAPHHATHPKEQIAEESADLLFHLLIFLNANQVSVDTVIETLANRNNKK